MSSSSAESPLVVTVTPNPSVDLLFQAERLVWDDANRLPEPRRRAGGQGFNVARAVRVLGGHALPVALLGGVTGGELSAMLAAEGQPVHAVPIDGETRVFVASREQSTGRSLLLNPRGPHCTAADGERLLAAVREVLATARPRWLACCGSVPPGIDSDLYARLAVEARAAGVRVVVDADGELLGRALEAGCDLLVPNQHEAARLVGEDAHEVADAARAARLLRSRGPDVVCVTLGERGAVIADASGAWHAAGPAAETGSAVGAGDAFLGAMLLAMVEGLPGPEVLKRGVAAGGAVLKSEGGDLLTVEEYRRLLDRVEVREVG